MVCCHVGRPGIRWTVSVVILVVVAIVVVDDDDNDDWNDDDVLNKRWRFENPLFGTKAHVVVDSVIDEKRNGERERTAGKMRRHRESIVCIPVDFFGRRTEQLSTGIRTEDLLLVHCTARITHTNVFVTSELHRSRDMRFCSHVRVCGTDISHDSIHGVFLPLLWTISRKDRRSHSNGPATAAHASLHMTYGV